MFVRARELDISLLLPLASLAGAGHTEQVHRIVMLKAIKGSFLKIKKKNLAQLDSDLIVSGKLAILFLNTQT